MADASCVHLKESLMNIEKYNWYQSFNVVGEIVFCAQCPFILHGSTVALLFWHKGDDGRKGWILL